MLEARNIKVTIGDTTIVDQVNMIANAGEVVAICGPNGAGKSTLLRVLSGELKPDQGEVSVQGRALSAWKAKELATTRALLHQQSVLNFPFTVREVVALGRFPYRHDEQHDEVVMTCLARVDMTAMAGRIYTTLSGGEQQRVQFARVLAQLISEDDRGKVLLLDEPTSALDLPHQNATLALASAQAKDLNYAVAVVLHDLNLAASWADRILFMNQGKIGAEGSPQAVMTPEVIASIYGLDTHILSHPDTGRPVVLVRRSTATTSTCHEPHTN